MKDYDFVTVYLPYVGAVARGEYSHLISEEVVAWLNEHVGNGTVSYRHWLLNYDNDTYQCTYKGTDYSSESHHTKIVRAFCFKDIDKASLFKLVWGG